MIYVLPASGTCNSCGSPGSLRLVDLDGEGEERLECRSCVLERDPASLVVGYTVPKDWREVSEIAMELAS